MKLIILNGPSGVGKSTLAARLHEQVPGSELLDIDAVRRTILNYRENKEGSLKLAYEQALAFAEQRLQEGKDVIVDKNILEHEVLDAFISSARSAGAEAYEFILFADKESVQARADARGYRPGGLLTPEKVGSRWERSNALRAERTNAIVMDTSNLSPDEVLTRVIEMLDI